MGPQKLNCADFFFLLNFFFCNTEILELEDCFISKKLKQFLEFSNEVTFHRIKEKCFKEKVNNTLILEKKKIFYVFLLFVHNIGMVVLNNGMQMIRFRLIFLKYFLT